MEPIEAAKTALPLTECWGLAGHVTNRKERVAPQSIQLCDSPPTVCRQTLVDQCLTLDSCGRGVKNTDHRGADVNLRRRRPPRVG